MFTESILNLVKWIIQAVFFSIPDLPQFEISLFNSLTEYIELIFDNVHLLGFFVRIGTIQALVPLVILAVNFERVYNFALYIIHKLPWSID